MSAGQATPAFPGTPLFTHDCLTSTQQPHHAISCNAGTRGVRWTSEMVAARFKEAVRTERALPAVRVQGYFSKWPTIIRQSREAYAADDQKITWFPPSCTKVDEMLETMHWIQVLEVMDRLIIWSYADGTPRSEIARRHGIGRTTLHRRHVAALQQIAVHLNGSCSVE